MSTAQTQKLAQELSLLNKSRNPRKPKKSTPKPMKKFVEKEVRRAEKKEVKKVKKQVIQKIIGQLPNINYEGAMTKYGKQVGPAMVHQKAYLCDDMAKLYALSQTMPAIYKSKIPDAFDRKTARYDSKKVFEISINNTATNGGTPLTFAFLVQPIIGNYGDPLQYQVAVCKPGSLANGAQSTINWLDASHYESVSTIDGFDLRVDSNFDALTQPPAGFYGVGAQSGMTPAKPFGTGTLINQPQNTNLNITYDSTSSAGTFIFPPGNYYVDIFITGSGLNALTPINLNGTVTSATSWAQLTNATQTASAAAFYITSTNVNNQFSFTVTGAAVANAALRVTPAAFDNAANNTDDGLIETIRPCAMSVLATYRGPVLTNGGNIAMALISSQAKESNFFTNSPDQPGSFRTWQTIASLNEAVYDGPLKDGAYGWWTQEDVTDYDLYPVSEMNSKNYPTIVCAGQYNPGEVISDGTIILRVEVELTFELTSVKTLLPKDKYVGSSACVDASKMMLQNQPKIMQNAQHTGWFKRLVGYIEKGAKFVGQVAPIVSALL